MDSVDIEAGQGNVAEHQRQQAGVPEWQTKEIRGALIVVMTLVMTLTFQIGINPPWGSWQDNLAKQVDSSGRVVQVGHKAGHPIMLTTDPRRYSLLVIGNFLGFLFSSLLVLSILAGQSSFLDIGNRAYFAMSFASLMWTYGLAQAQIVYVVFPCLEAVLFLYLGYIVLKRPQKEII